jgi:thiol-disulfide isomerase/thioredoxin
VASTRRPRLVVYHAPGCGLCGPALATVAEVAAELGLEHEAVDVTGDPELEARHREWLPVVEIDGRRAFTYFVQREALVERLREAG